MFALIGEGMCLVKRRKEEREEYIKLFVLKTPVATAVYRRAKAENVELCHNFTKINDRGTRRKY